MVLHALAPSFDRVTRADKHLAVLERRLDVAVRRQERAVSVDFNPLPPHDFRIIGPTKTHVGTIIGILVGEVCYNLRSALDYLVFELAKLDSGCPQNGTQFPLESTNTGFVAHEKSWLKGISHAHRAMIERLQPYNLCHWAGRLREISNRDKHRELAHIEGQCRVHAYSRVSDDNFDRIQAPISRALHPVHGEVDVKIHIYCPITLGGDMPIMDDIRQIKNGVADTLAMFKPDF